MGCSAVTRELLTIDHLFRSTGNERGFKYGAGANCAELAVCADSQPVPSCPRDESIPGFRCVGTHPPGYSGPHIPTTRDCLLLRELGIEVVDPRVAAFPSRLRGIVCCYQRPEPEPLCPVCGKPFPSRLRGIVCCYLLGTANVFTAAQTIKFPSRLRGIVYCYQTASLTERRRMYSFHPDCAGLFVAALSPRPQHRPGVGAVFIPTTRDCLLLRDGQDEGADRDDPCVSIPTTRDCLLLQAGVERCGPDQGVDRRFHPDYAGLFIATFYRQRKTL